ncbi:hypothetical protein AB0H87_27405, partial [Asanoa sp. NPDC050611]
PPPVESRPIDESGRDGKAAPKLSDATRALRIRRYTSPTTPGPEGDGLAAGSAGNGSADGAGRDGGKKTGKGAAVGDGGGAESSGERGQDTVSIEPRTPATGNGASGELPDRTEGIGSATPPVPSHERPAPPAAGDRSADPAPDGASQVKDPSGKDA